MARLSRGFVVLMAMMAAISAVAAIPSAATTATAAASVYWGEPCSAEAKTKIEKCMDDKTADMEKCCPILHSLIDNSCPCWRHAVTTDKQLAILYFTYCDIVHPLCSTAEVKVM